MMEERIIEEAKAYIQGLFRNNSDGHGADHSLRVFQNAWMIAKSYPECDLHIVLLSALLHDVDDHKLFKTENNQNARAFLKSQNMKDDTIDRICNVINGVSFSKNRDKHPETLEGKIVQDADRLDAIGAIGIARTFAFGGKNGRSIEASVQHFHDKLLLLKDAMNTEEARNMAEARHACMVQFLSQLDQELNCPVSGNGHSVDD